MNCPWIEKKKSNIFRVRTIRTPWLQSITMLSNYYLLSSWPRKGLVKRNVCALQTEGLHCSGSLGIRRPCFGPGYVLNIQVASPFPNFKMKWWGEDLEVFQTPETEVLGSRILSLIDPLKWYLLNFSSVPDAGDAFESTAAEEIIRVFASLEVAHSWGKARHQEVSENMFCW